MTLQHSFTKIANRLAQPDADVRQCLFALNATGRRFSLSEAQTMRLWRRWTQATGRRFI